MTRKHLTAFVVSCFFVIVVVALGNKYLFSSIDKEYAFGIDQLKSLETTGLPHSLFVNSKDMLGKSIDAESFQKNIVIVTFWASWCAPCVEEFPSFIQLLQKKNNIIILAISLDETESEALSFLKSMKIDGLNQKFLFIFDSNKKISTGFGVIRLPESFIFSSSGRLEKKIIGATDWSTPASLNYLNSLN